MMRNMIKQKFYSSITILGLTVGITFALLIGIFIWGEMQVNTDIKDIDRLYLLETKYKSAEGNSPPFFVPALLGQQAIEKYPTVFEKRSEEHTSELQSHSDLVCRLLLEK